HLSNYLPAPVRSAGAPFSPKERSFRTASTIDVLFRFQVETIVEDVQQNSKHQQHRPGQEDSATVENGSLHRENKEKPITQDRIP
ncbi:unnamed protein product, partial [Gulo gulo]